ncbi:MAG: response regulator [Magnetococcus sp. WYHC-3]
MSVGKRRILIVDDDSDGRALLRRYLTWLGCEVLEAVNGRDAVLVFARERPDLVIMDIHMPSMDGLDAARRIKELCGDRLVPLLFLTADGDDNVHSEGLRAGGDDFLVKPVTRTILKARMDAWWRVQELTDSLRQHRDHLMAERTLVEGILQGLRARMPDERAAQGLRWSLHPVETVSGDLLLTALRPDGARHVLLGDFTGYGLPAAIAAPLVDDVFHSMTAKGFAPGVILGEIHRKIQARLSRDITLKALFLHVDCAQRMLLVWNGGMPTAVVLRDGEILHRLPPTYPPLGDASVSQPHCAGTLLGIAPGDRLFACSNGVFGPLDDDGSCMDHPRLENILRTLYRQGQSLLAAHALLREQRGRTPQDDDITLLEWAFHVS